jgi:hypothetical protein
MLMSGSAKIPSACFMNRPSGGFHEQAIARLHDFYACCSSGTLEA